MSETNRARLQEWVQLHVPARHQAKALTIVRAAVEGQKVTWDEFWQNPHMCYNWIVMTYLQYANRPLKDAAEYRNPRPADAQAWRDGQRAGERLSACVVLPTGGANTRFMRAAVENMRARRAAALSPVATVLRKITLKKFIQRVFELTDDYRNDRIDSSRMSKEVLQLCQDYAPTSDSLLIGIDAYVRETTYWKEQRKGVPHGVE